MNPAFARKPNAASAHKKRDSIQISSEPQQDEAVQQTISAAGQPLPPEVKRHVEVRFNQDFSSVRIHTDANAAESARAQHAKAYTFGDHIVFAEGQYAPDNREGKKLLGHELAHVVQQQRGGSAPPMDPQGAHEQDADRAGNQLASSTAPVQVAGATAVGVAQSPDDWLEGGLDVSNWGYSDLLDERNALLQWQDRQITSDENSMYIEEGLNVVNARLAELEQHANAAPAAPKKGSSKRRGKTQRTNNNHASPPIDLTDAPRVLADQASLVYEDPEQMRQEFDKMVAWLQRPDVSPEDREALQSELANLSPLLEQQLQGKAQQRRQDKIRKALTPITADDTRTSLRNAVALVDGIRPMDGQSDRFYLMHGSEMIVLSREEAEGIRNGVIAELLKAGKRVYQMNQDSWSKLEYQAEADRENGFAAWGVSLFTDTTTVDLLDEAMPINNAADDAYYRLTAAGRRGDLGTMAEELANAESQMLRCRNLVNAHVEDIQSTGQKVITGLEITKAASFTIVMIATAGAAAPVVGAGVAGAEITGVAATGLTALGTGGVVAAEGFVLGGGSRMTGELATGKSLKASAAAGLEEGKQWAETGGKIGVGAVMAPAVAARFGAGAPNISGASQLLRTAAAGGTTNVAVEATDRALLHGELMSGREAAATFVGGAMGSAGGKLAEGFKSPALQGVANVAIGAGSSGAATYLETGDTDQAFEAAALGGAVALGMGGQVKPSKKTLDKAHKVGANLRSSAKSTKNAIGSSLRAAMLGARLSGAAPAIPGSTNAPIRPPAVGMLEPAPTGPQKSKTPTPKAVRQEAEQSPTKMESKAVDTKEAITKSVTPAAKPALRTTKKTPSKSATPSKAPGKAAAKPTKQAKSPAQAKSKNPSKSSRKTGNQGKTRGDVANKTLDERISQANEDLGISRQKTVKYFEERKKAGRSLKGGPKKGIDNAKELLWLLKRQQAYPDRQILHNCEVKGVRRPDGTVDSTASIAKTGREPDFMEVNGREVTLGELKSEWEFDKSLKGGPGTKEGGPSSVSKSSKLGGQYKAEDAVLQHARKLQGKIVVSGFDLKTGQRLELEFEPSQVKRALYSSTSGWGIGSEWTN